MGKDFYECSAAAREVYNAANCVLGLNLASLCFSGPEQRLNQTDISQPAIYATSVASFRAACEAGLVDPQGVKAYAGLSLGEYTALHLAGVFSFEDGLKLVAARGRYMQEAADAAPGGMVALLGADAAAVAELCAQVAEGEVLPPANYNAPGQIVASGTAAACGRLAVAAEARGFKAIALKVAGAFHSAMMQPAAEKMAHELREVRFAAPRAAVYTNVTAEPHGDAASMRDRLVEQVTHPVKWEQTMNALLAAGEWDMVELCPGRSLAGMLKKINRRLAVRGLSTADVLRK